MNLSFNHVNGIHMPTVEPSRNDLPEPEDAEVVEISIENKLLAISNIKQSLLKDQHLRGEIFADKLYEDEQLMSIVNLICDWLDAKTQPRPTLDMCEIGRMMTNLVNERFHKMAAEEFESE